MFHRKTNEERLKENKHVITRQTRSADREIQQLDREEAKLIADIKKAAKNGQQGTVNILAKEVGRIRKQRERMTQTKAQMRGVTARQTEMQSAQKMAKSLGVATQGMQMMNKQMNMEQIMATTRAFDKAQQEMDMKEEMMDDAFEAMDGDEVEGEANLEVQKALESIGIDLAAELSSHAAPSYLPAKETPAAEGKSTDGTGDIDLDARLSALLKG